MHILYSSRNLVVAVLVVLIALIAGFAFNDTRLTVDEELFVNGLSICRMGELCLPDDARAELKELEGPKPNSEAKQTDDSIFSGGTW